MKAILCRYLGPTNYRPSRIKASASDVPSVTVSFDHGSEDPDRVAADALCAKYGWEGELIKGTLPNGDAVFVFAS